MDQNQTESSQTQTQSQSQGLKVNPLQILVNAAFIAYNKGAFSMREASIISQSIDFFVETNQAVVPQFMPSQTQPTPTPTTITTSQKPSENLTSIPEEIPHPEQEKEKVTFLSQ